MSSSLGTSLGDPGDLANTSYARKRKELLQLTRELFAMGAETVIDLPRIAVIGGQSAGKSSLVEAVSGISVPRDSGTCTRCPMECSMISAQGDWSCQVSLRFAYDNKGRPLKASRRKPAVAFGPLITSKSDVDIWLRRAQMAILSTHLQPDTFYAMSAEQLRQHGRTDNAVQKFSNNVVSVEIRDPDSTDLAFIDLPGLVQNESDDAIELVRTLVESNIQGESTIILVTIPASDDMENQQAVRLARQADPDGKRTIGILTKPDSLTPGATSARDKWRDVLSGNTYRLAHGYYCVRLPDDDERQRNISRAQAEQVAGTFFQTTSPWKELIINHANRFGVANFVTDVGNLLLKVIEEALPNLKKSLQKLIADNDTELSALPPVPSGNPIQELLGMVTGFCDELRDTVHGQQQDKRSVQSNRALYTMFKTAIRRTAPDFRPFENYKLFTTPKDPDSDEEGEAEEDTNAPKVRTLDLWGVRRVIQGSIAWELKNTIPFDAKKTLINEYVTLWDGPAHLCFNDVYAKLRLSLEKLLLKYFGRFKRLYDDLKFFLGGELDRHRTSAFNNLQRTLDLEKNPFYTQNDHYLDSVREKWLLHYRHIRGNESQYRTRDKVAVSHIVLEPSSPSARPSTGLLGTWTGPERPVREAYYVEERIETEEDRALRSLAKLGYKGLKIADLKRLHPPDEFNEELAVMADVRAYFQVAYKRIIDYVPLTIEHSLNQALSNALQGSIFAHLDFASDDAADRLKDLLSEDPAVAIRRHELEERRKRLVEIQQKLNNFSL